MVEGWIFYTTPISILGASFATKKPFTYLISLQVMVLSALYKRKRVKPMLAFFGTSSLMLLAIYDVWMYPLWHNMFACIFFIAQPIIFYMEYRKKKDTYSLTKFAIMLFLIILVTTDLISIPIFEFVSYALLIAFL